MHITERLGYQTDLFLCPLRLKNKYPLIFTNDWLQADMKTKVHSIAQILFCKSQKTVYTLRGACIHTCMHMQQQTEQ